MLEKESKTDLGVFNLHDDVIASIAALAAKEVKGVAGLVDSRVGRLFRFFGKKNFYAGVKILSEMGEKKIVIFVIVDYGENIPTLAKDVQENVTRRIEEMTGLYNIEVLVNVQGVTLGEKEKQTQL